MSDNRLAADDLPPLSAVVARHGLAPKKALGQNFLFDLNLTAKVARASGDLEGAEVLEIGPGPGGLTRALIGLGAARVVAVERDPRCLAALAEIEAHWPGRLEVIEADALRFDASGVFDGPFRIVANLPYNIGTELLIRWIASAHWPPRWDSLTLMFQREVAERIVAVPGSKAYGRLSVLAGWRTEARIMFDVPPEAFTPAPKVVSSVISLRPRAEPIDVPLKALEQVTAAAFGQRRKMLRRSLAGIGGEALIEAAGLEPTRRAEEIDIAGFCALARCLKSIGTRPG